MHYYAYYLQHSNGERTIRWVHKTESFLLLQSEVDFESHRHITPLTLKYIRIMNDARPVISGRGLSQGRQLER